MVGDSKVPDILLKTDLKCLDVFPSSHDLIGAEIELIQVKAREKVLKGVLQEVRDDYQFILIDCPPSLGILTLNALSAADEVLIPVQCEYYAMEGLSSLMKTIQVIQRGYNPRLTVGGIILTMFDRRNNLSHQVSQDLRNHFPSKVFKTVIPRNVKLSEAPSHGLPALLYDVSSRGARAYLDLAREIMNGGN